MTQCCVSDGTSLSALLLVQYGTWSELKPALWVCPDADRLPLSPTVQRVRKTHQTEINQQEAMVSDCKPELARTLQDSDHSHRYDGGRQ